MMFASNDEEAESPSLKKKRVKDDGVNHREPIDYKMDFDKLFTSKNIDLINMRDPLVAGLYKPMFLERMGVKIFIELAD